MSGDRKLPLITMAWLLAALPAVAPAAETEAPAPDRQILSDIAQRQTDLAVLELELRKAELQKKLRDLQGAGPPPGLAAMPVPLPVVDAAVPAARIADGPARTYSVQRIHRVGGRLAAELRLPGGDTRNLFAGGKLEKDLKVVAVSPDEVTVRRGDGEPYPLPVAAAADRR
ncbi:MAG TPA: type IV pilus biogenesis protein PilP [Rhodospirillaceae bacterium]|nr:type IV pilus biogenesis protein PilP [Rhodospirillaceae bacterium]